MYLKSENRFINNIEEIDRIELNRLISLTDSNKIEINFEESSEMIFNNFINENNNLKSIYVKNNNKVNIDIVEIDFELYLFFVECVEKAYNFINNKNKSEYLELFGDITTWNFCIFENIMFDYPFTLSNIIYMPIQYIRDNLINNDYISLTKTIIHEKLHVGQRKNPFIWDQYIINKDNNWIRINYSDEKFTFIENNIKNNKSLLIETNEEFISNPDTYYNDFKYLYRIGDNLYWANYIYNSDLKKIKIKYFELDIPNKKLKKTNKYFDQDHPYETYAYIISEEIVK